MNKYFIITVDTEGDNLWSYHKGDTITTRNAHYIPRFQALCDQYGFKPVYLTNYEMALEPFFVESAKEWLEAERCEVGIHPHAWNNPPVIEFKDAKYSGNPYLIEYEKDIMYSKFDTLYQTIYKQFGVFPESHRAGRWAMNDTYFQLLKDFNIKVDCSVTPYIDWSRNLGAYIGGADYSLANIHPHEISGILEVPVTVRRLRNVPGTLRSRLKSIIRPHIAWLRPATEPSAMMESLIRVICREKDCNYLELMLHSSELMPDGSPYFKAEADVNILYSRLETIFKYVSSLGYCGCTLSAYAQIMLNSSNDKSTVK